MLQAVGVGFTSKGMVNQRRMFFINTSDRLDFSSPEITWRHTSSRPSLYLNSYGRGALYPGSMVKRKQPVQEDKVIHDLSDMVEFNVTELLNDGRKRKRASLYVVKVRPTVESNRPRKATKTLRAPPATEDGLSVLKIVRKRSSWTETYTMRTAI